MLLKKVILIISTERKMWVYSTVRAMMSVGRRAKPEKTEALVSVLKAAFDEIM